MCPAYRDLGEECDDMNKMNGDGCSLFCLQELSFNCIGKSGAQPFHSRWATALHRVRGKKSTVFSAFPTEELSWKREKKVEFVGLKGEHIFPASGHFDGKLVLLALKQPRT